MKVRVEFYSRLRELVGASFLDTSLRNGATVRDLIEQRCQTHPPLRAYDNSLLFGLGVEFVEKDQVLHEGDVVAVMPPVQGG